MKYKYFKDNNSYFNFYNKVKDEIKVVRIYHKGSFLCMKYRLKEDRIWKI